MADVDAEPGLLAHVLGRAAFEFYANIQPMLPTYIHLILSALFPIYVGAHASLSRPPSAAKPTKQKRKTEDQSSDDDDTDQDDEEERLMEGLSPADAILMPLFAGTALASLYFLLKWMEDPALLNKILNAYFAIFGVFSVARLVTDMLGIGHSIIFPRRYALGGALYHINGKDQTAVPISGDIQDKTPIGSPLPGFLSRIPLTIGIRKILWADRAMPGHKWTLKLHVHHMFTGKCKIGPHGLVGVVAGLVAVAYFNLVDKPWYLTNLLGFGFSYGALQLMSPTTFATGSLILGALFFYDIYFVFFTPMMVTVAKSLDVPIKLMFPRPGPADEPSAPPSHAMLGLGDVVLPGIMIGLALRYDLYLFYLRRQKRTPSTDANKEETVEKPKYFSLAGRWSDHFWTHSLTGQPLWTSPVAGKAATEEPFTFPKTYFKASLTGYVLGMLATLGVMMVWNHAQPALLYLVPGVVGSLWLTALFRGELDLMWNYTEDIAEEEAEKDKKSQEGKDSNSGAKGDGAIAKLKSGESGTEDEQVKSKKRSSSRRSDRELLSFSIQAPWSLKNRHSSHKKPKSYTPIQIEEKKKHNWAPSSPASQTEVTEHAGKRVRLK